MTIIRLSKEGHIISSMKYRDGEDKKWYMSLIKDIVASKQTIKDVTAVYKGKKDGVTVIAHWIGATVDEDKMEVNTNG